MKTKLLIAVSSALLLSSGCTTTANSADTVSDAPKEAMSMSKMSDDGKPMMRMQDQMQKMKSQMTEIKKTDDVDKRDALIKEHRASMHKMMGMMQGMHTGKPMMGSKKMEDKKMGNCNMEKHAKHKEHMQMMQMMMKHMMKNQDETEKTIMMREHKMKHKMMN